jgi:hypothetical protein
MRQGVETLDTFFTLGSMKPLLCACLLFLLSHSARAQAKIADFGDVDLGELTLKDCPFEKGAAAMNLLKTAKIGMDVSEFSGNLTLTTEYRVRIKVFNKQGFSAANIKIPYVGEGHAIKIKDIEAFIYSLDSTGAITKKKVEKRDVFKNRSKAVGSLNYISFTFPDIYNGAILEYKYTKVEKNSLSMQPWFFQDKIPTAFSRVVADIPFYAYLTYRTIGSDHLEKDSSFRKRANSINDENIYSFTMRNVHSLRPEPMMYSLSDNLERLEFALSPRSMFHSGFLSNEEKMKMQNWYLLRSRHFGYQCDKPVEGVDRLIDSVRNLPQKRDRIAAIYSYIVKNIHFNGEQRFLCDSLENCLTSGSGSSAEINILFLNLLRKVGVKCMPLLVSTHENGNPDIDFPTMSQFNGVDVMVRDSSLSFIIDCTQKLLSYDMPPYNVLNSNTYIVDANASGWLFVFDSRILSKTETVVESVMDSAGSFRGNATIREIGFAKQATMDELDKKEEKSGEDKSTENESIAGLVVDTAAMENAGTVADTLVERVSFRYLPATSGDIYFINPYLFLGFKRNPFTDSVRYSDVDFGCNQSYTSRLRIKLARNFSLESMPEDRLIQNPDSNIVFKRRVYMEGSYLIVENSFLLKNTIFIKEEYGSLKSFFDRFYAFQNDVIPIKRRRR